MRGRDVRPVGGDFAYALAVLREARMARDRGDRDFRWRGGEVSRLEGFSDAVFGFSLTLLVVSLEVPRSFDDLAAAMRQLVAFGICFILFLGLWERHYRFFRRFGLEDGVTVILNGALLFVVLCYVYPLKFLFTLFIEGIVFGVQTVSIEPWQTKWLFVIYGTGFAAVFGCYALLYLHAYRRRAGLDLDELEQAVTRAEIERNLALAGLGGVSGLIAVLVPTPMVGLAGYSYLLVGAIETWHGMRAGGLRKKHLRPQGAGDQVPPP
jgi:transmembrane protein TMEM174 (potassium channel)